MSPALISFHSSATEPLPHAASPDLALGSPALQSHQSPAEQPLSVPKPCPQPFANSGGCCIQASTICALIKDFPAFPSRHWWLPPAFFFFFCPHSWGHLVLSSTDAGSQPTELIPGPSCCTTCGEHEDLQPRQVLHPLCGPLCHLYRTSVLASS